MTLEILEPEISEVRKLRPQTFGISEHRAIGTLKDKADVTSEPRSRKISKY